MVNKTKLKPIKFHYRSFITGSQPIIVVNNNTTPKSRFSQILNLLALLFLIYVGFFSDIPTTYKMNEEGSNNLFYIYLVLICGILLLNLFRAYILNSIKFPESRVATTLISFFLTKFVPFLSTLSVIPILRVAYYYFFNGFEDSISFRFFKLYRNWSETDKFKLVEMYFSDPTKQNVEYGKYLTQENTRLFVEKAKNKEELYNILKTFLSDKKTELELLSNQKAMAIKTDWTSYLALDTTSKYILCALGGLVIITGVILTVSYFSRELESNELALQAGYERIVANEEDIATMKVTITELTAKTVELREYFKVFIKKIEFLDRTATRKFDVLKNSVDETGRLVKHIVDNFEMP